MTMTYPLPSSTDQIADLHLSTASRGAELNLVHGGAVDPSDIIFGCGPIVTDRSGPIELTQVDAAVHAALEAGVVHFDTAPLYGDSEDRLGHALAASPLGSSAVVMTKAGKVIRRLCPLRHVASLGPEPWTPFAIPLEERCLLPDYTAAGARKSYTESCQRMGLSSLHTLRIHDADSIEGAFAAATAPDGLIAGLMQLKAEGAIQHVSLGMNANIDHKVVTPGTGGLETTAWQPDDILRVIRASPEGCFDSALLAYSWSLFSQDGWPVLQECAARGIEVHIAGIWAGLHHVNAGSVRANTTHDATTKKMDRWRTLAAGHGCSVEAVAVAFAALPSVVGKVVMGMKSAEEVATNVAAAAEAATVPSRIWAQAQAQGLLPAHLPLPA